MRISDWSSDVCSSDLTPLAPQNLMRSTASETGPSLMGVQAAGITPATIPTQLLGQPVDIQFGGVDADRWRLTLDFLTNVNMSDAGHLTGYFTQIGRASCRGRVWQSV